MTAQPGWYPAGVPGRERWWDGTQWTPHERDVLVQPAPAAPLVPAGAPMGWYAFPPSGETRWWNGVYWTAYRLKNGRPAADAMAVEPPSMGWVLGGLFGALGLLHFVRSLLDPSGIVLGVAMLALSVFWLIGAGRDTARRKVAAPGTAPLLDESLRPFPGEVEGQGAGWYPVAGSISRWWTGTRWAHYVADRGRVRPTHFGPRGYRVLVAVAAVFGVLGVLALVLGIVLAAGADALLGPDGFAGLLLIVVGAALVLIAGIVWLSIHLRRYALLLPPEPPRRAA